MTKRRRLRGIALLVALAVGIVPTIGLNFLLWLHVEAEGRQDLRDAATAMLRQVDHNLDAAATAVVGLGMAGPGCTPADLVRFRRTLLKTTEIEEIAFTGKGGEPSCTVGNEVRRVVRRLSPDNDTAAPQLKMSVGQVGNSGPRVVQLLWHDKDGGTLRALVPGERLIPAVVVGRLQAEFLTRVLLVDGTMIAQHRAAGEGGSASDGPSTTEMRLLSARYPVAVVTAVRPGDLWGSYGEIFFYGNLGGAALTLLMMLGALTVARLMEGPERHIEESLRRGEFVPYYQPVIDLRTGRLMGCEVLVRRRRRDGGIESPASFIPMAEATGQIYDITRALMARARDELGPSYGPRPHLKISFNLVAGHFVDFGVIDDIRDTFAGCPMRPTQLVFEVTERQQLPDLTRARAVIAKLQEFGARVSVDDVGTGHGGLSYLMTLGVDQMKVDKMFIDAIGTDRYSAAIVDTLIKLAVELGIELVAEGVETDAQAAYLRARGVRAAQGYVFSPALPAEAYVALIEALEPLAASPRPAPRPAEAVKVA